MQTEILIVYYRRLRIFAIAIAFIRTQLPSAFSILLLPSLSDSFAFDNEFFSMISKEGF